MNSFNVFPGLHVHFGLVLTLWDPKAISLGLGFRALGFGI